MWKKTNDDRNYLIQQKYVEFLLFRSRFSSSVGLYSTSSKLSLSLFIILLPSFIILCSLTFLFLDVLGSLVIACCSIQRHPLALEAKSDIFIAFLLPTQLPMIHNLLPARLHHTRGPFLLQLFRRWQSVISFFFCE